jgi:hypothetical protein
MKLLPTLLVLLLAGCSIAPKATPPTKAVIAAIVEPPPPPAELICLNVDLEDAVPYWLAQTEPNHLAILMYYEVFEEVECFVDDHWNHIHVTMVVDIARARAKGRPVDVIMVPMGVRADYKRTPGETQPGVHHEELPAKRG